MTILKYFSATFLLVLIVTSCNNTPDVVSSDNYYQLRKQLFIYKGSVDLTAEIRKNAVDFTNDSLEQLIKIEAEKTILYIDSVKTYLINYFKVQDPNILTKEGISNYSFNDSLFAYIHLNQIFCGKHGNIPQAKFSAYTVRKAIKDYYEAVKKITGDKTNRFILYPNDYDDREGATIGWEYQNFYKTNLITTLTVLEKLKQDLYFSFVDIKYHRRHDA